MRKSILALSLLPFLPNGPAFAQTPATQGQREYRDFAAIEVTK